jgi:hypothetical protein
MFISFTHKEITARLSVGTVDEQIDKTIIRSGHNVGKQMLADGLALQKDKISS